MRSSVEGPSPVTLIDLIAASLPIEALVPSCAAIALFGTTVALPAITKKASARIIDVFVIHFMRSSLLFPGKGDFDILFTYPAAVIFKLFNHINSSHANCRYTSFIFTDRHPCFQYITFSIRVNNHSLIFFGTSHNANQPELADIKAMYRQSCLECLFDVTRSCRRNSFYSNIRLEWVFFTTKIKLIGDRRRCKLE